MVDTSAGANSGTFDDGVSTERYRELTREIERVIRSIDATDRDTPAVERLASGVTTAMGTDLGFLGGRLYMRHGDNYRLWSAFGDAAHAQAGLEVPVTYHAVQRALENGTVYMAPGDEGYDPEIEQRLGVSTFAAAALGENNEYLLAFDVAQDHEHRAVVFTLELLRHFLNVSLEQDRIRDVFREARRIQSSIVPTVPPDFPGFDIWGRQEPLERVGGDFYDYFPVSSKILGLAIADVSGHGLPAALQVRDIYTGLRMGISRDFKIVRTMERLNRIVNRSSLTGRYVSMVYGELEVDGTLIYCNAGHLPPVHVCEDGSHHWLETGGVVLGPLPDVAHTRGYLTMQPGDLVIFYTDGITETRCGGHGVGRPYHEYGADRLVEVALEHRALSAREIVEAIFEGVASFCEGAEARDDRTVAVVKRLP